MVCAALAAVALAFFLLVPSPRTPYLVGAPAFALAALCFSGMWFAVTFLCREQAAVHAYAHALGIVSFAALGYAFMEGFYAFIPVGLGLKTSSVAWQLFFTQLDIYVLDRSYQYIAIGCLFCGVWFALGNEFTHAWRFGDLTVRTAILGNETPMSWKRAFLRLASMLVGITIVGLVLRPSLQISDAHLCLYAALLIGGFNNSFIEELVFRGLLLPAFALRLSPEAANRLQAVLFSIVHYSYVGDDTWNPVIQEVSRLFLYVGIGWVFGRATRETGGIGVSTGLHFLITSAIWAFLTFTRPV